MENITKARTSIINAKTVAQKAKASNMLSDTLKSLFAVAENYPNLKANENFLKLQEELASTENKISYARQNYNDMVMLFNTKIEVFPNNLFARALGFKEEEQFHATAEEKKVPKVKF